MSGQILPLPGKRDLMKQILRQSERTQPSADKTAKQRTEQQQKSHCIKGKSGASGQNCLQSSDGAGAKRSRAGVAIQPRHTDGLCGTCIDFPCKKAKDIPVSQRSKSNLHPKSYSFTQFQYTPDIYKLL
jgi:hypothetical protein